MKVVGLLSLRVVALAALVVMTGCQHGGKGRVPSAPAVGKLKRVADLPSGVIGLAWRNGMLWSSKYHGQGKFLRVDPKTGTFDFVEIGAAMEFAKMGGSVCFAGNEMWIGDAYGEAFGSVDMETRRVLKVFWEKYFAEKSNSQSYSSLAFDGENIWMALHYLDYDLPAAQTQLLLKRDWKTGKVLKAMPAPAGTANDTTHGLMWDGVFLWHGKDNRLCKVDPKLGEIKGEHRLAGVERISGLAWNGKTMWILEFDGKLWELPFE